jgi:putative ABC transport system substrate-binding protein
MRRREFLIAAIATGGSLATGAAGQVPGKPKRVGWIGAGAAPNEPDAWMGVPFVARLRELGWIEGRTIEFLRRRPGAGANEQRVEGLARELVEQKVDLIFAPFGPHAIFAHKVAGSIPLVFAFTSDPVRGGLTTSLARPDRNATGPSTLYADLWGPRIQILSEVLPKPRRVAVLMNPDVDWQNRAYAQIREICAKLGLASLQVAARRREDFEGAIDLAVREGADALTYMPDGVFALNSRALVKLVARTRLAATYSGPESVDDGGLMTYSTDSRDVMRKAAEYVDRILRGARASDLPIERPTRVYLVLNQKTAKAQGITFPQSLLLRADRVIE